MKQNYLTAILALGLFGANAQTTVTLDPVEAISGAPSASDFWDGSNQANFRLASPAPGTSGQYSVEGEGAGTDLFKKKWNTPVNISSISSNAEGYLSFWFYVSDASKLSAGGQVELTSSGASDSGEMNWAFPTVETGWNEIKLYFKDGSGSFNASGVNYFRIYSNTVSSSVITRIDDMKFSYDEAPVGYTFFDRCESSRNWDNISTNGPITLDRTDKKQGVSSIKTSAGTHIIRFRKSLPTTLNTGITEADGYLSFWLYVADATKVTNGLQVKISSFDNGDSENQYYRWDNFATLSTGWNKVVLKLSNAIKSLDGGANLNQIKSFRMLYNTSSAMVSKLDDIRFSNDLNTLPVNVTSFGAVKSGDNVKLSWVTASEINNSHFVILRSVNGSEFTALSNTVKAKGAGSYSFYDTNPENGINYYKLVQVDDNGTRNEFNKGVSVDFNLQKNQQQLSVYPNPTSGGFTVKWDIEGNEIVDVNISDLTGRLLVSKKVSSDDLKKGIFLREVPAGLSGIYILKIITASGKEAMAKVLVN